MVVVVVVTAAAVKVESAVAPVIPSPRSRSHPVKYWISASEAPVEREHLEAVPVAVAVVVVTHGLPVAAPRLSWQPVEPVEVAVVTTAATTVELVARAVARPELPVAPEPVELPVVPVVRRLLVAQPVLVVVTPVRPVLLLLVEPVVMAGQLPALTVAPTTPAAAVVPAVGSAT